MRRYPVLWRRACTPPAPQGARFDRDSSVAYRRLGETSEGAKHVDHRARDNHRRRHGNRRAPPDRRAPARGVPRRPVPLTRAAVGAAGSARGHGHDPSNPDRGGDERRLRRTPGARDRPDRGPRRRRPGCLRGRASRRVDCARAAAGGPGSLRQRSRVRRPPAEGRGRQHQPLELPVRPLRRPAGRDAGGREPGRPEALGAHTGLLGGAAGHGARNVRRRPRRRRGRRPRARPGLHQGALGPSALHGEPRDRARDSEGGGREPGAGHARARRQVPGDPRRATRSTPSR